VITWFTVGNQPTLPTYIYTKVKFGVTPEVNAVATVMLVATLLIFGVASIVLGRATRRTSRKRAATPG
jgi:ABC-type spermidine/putrescine transport system permease subunit II